MSVCDHLNLLEKDYYGLAIWETPSMKVSLTPFIQYFQVKRQMFSSFRKQSDPLQPDTVFFDNLQFVQMLTPACCHHPATNINDGHCQLPLAATNANEDNI